MSVELANPSSSSSGPSTSSNSAQPTARPAIPPRISSSTHHSISSGASSTSSNPSVNDPFRNKDASSAPSNPSSSSSSVGCIEDPYVRDYRQSRCLYYWYRWINPWVRMLLIFIILYLYAMSSGVLTYRNNDFQDEMQRYTNQVSNPNDPTSPAPGDPTSTRPRREYGVDDYPYLQGREYVPFILRDLWFDFIPALQGNDYTQWSTFVDATPIIWNVIMLCMLLIRLDIIRLSEYISIQMILFSVNALVHVSTTYPDSNGYQSSCKDIDKHVSGAWMFHYITTALLPIIMIRRLMWDFLGWNISWGVTPQVNRTELLEHHPWIFSGIYNNYERNNLFLQYVKGHQARMSAAAAAAQTSTTQPSDEVKQQDGVMNAKPLETYKPQYADAQRTTSSAMPPLADSQIADQLALQPHEQTDIHLNINEATAIHPSDSPNVDHDAFFKIYKSPYQTPDLVERFRPFFFILATTVRIVMIVWFTFLLIGLVLCRYHYSSDIIVAVFVTSLTATNTRLLQWWVRTLCYRPYYRKMSIINNTFQHS